MDTITGIVIIVQEGRFQLVDDRGVAHHFILSHGAAAEPQQLTRLQRETARVSVSYREAPNMIGHTATAIRVLDPAWDPA